MRDEVLRLTKGVIPPVRYACEHGVDFDSVCEACSAISVHPAHPLKNPESRHYDMVDGIEAVDRLEQMYSKEDLMAWAKISAMKYRLRIGHKDDVAKEAKKIATFEAYFKYLKEMSDEV